MNAFVDRIIKPLAEDANSTFQSIAQSEAIDLAEPTGPVAALRAALDLVAKHVGTAQTSPVVTVLQALRAIEELVSKAEGGFQEKNKTYTVYNILLPSLHIQHIVHNI